MAAAAWSAVLQLATTSYRSFRLRSPTGRSHLLEVVVRPMMHGEVVLDGQIRGRIQHTARPNGSVGIVLDGPDGPVLASIGYRSLLAAGGMEGVRLVIDDVVLYRE